MARPAPGPGRARAGWNAVDKYCLTLLCPTCCNQWTLLSVLLITTTPPHHHRHPLLVGVSKYLIPPSQSWEGGQGASSRQQARGAAPLCWLYWREESHQFFQSFPLRDSLVRTSDEPVFFKYFLVVGAAADSGGISKFLSGNSKCLLFNNFLPVGPNK